MYVLYISFLHIIWWNNTGGVGSGGEHLLTSLMHIHYLQLGINLTMHNGAPFSTRTLNFNAAIPLWWESGVSHPPFLAPDVTCLFPRSSSPSQPVPYLLNPASVTALNAKALPRQMIKVSSQFTFQSIDLMFPNLPGLFLKLPRTFRIFYSIPLFLLPPPHVSAASATKNRDDRDISLVMFAYESRLHSADYKNGLLKITRLRAQRRHLRGRPLQNIPPFTAQLLLLIHLLFQILF